MYFLRHFAPWEFVPRIFYEKMGTDCLQLVNTVMLATADDLRDYFSRPVVCNNYLGSGTNEYRGFRPAFCTVGAAESMHRIGGALDLTIQGVSAEEARQAILKHSDKFPYITRMESGVDWLHIDNKKTNVERITLFKAT
jgi:hypothetical protein